MKIMPVGMYSGSRWSLMAVSSYGSSWERGWWAREICLDLEGESAVLENTVLVE